MQDKRFNLLEEPWIKVIDFAEEVKEVSLLQLFEGAHNYRALAGELPTQDVAILRVLLAVLHVVFERMDSSGNLAVFGSPAMALDRFRSLWGRQQFPMVPIEKYLRHYEDRFYLFHDQYPFFQVPKIGKSTEYGASKLIGELSESANKVRLFAQRTGDNKASLDYPEACRWLIHLNAYDDTSGKKVNKDCLSPGAGWLGKLSLVTAVGNNLFETLMLNCVFLKDGGNDLWARERPVWENPTVKSEERTEIKMPEHPASLYTVQSRRLLLLEQKGRVIGYKLLGGDFFSKENSLAEQMTLWRNGSKKKSDPPEYHPKRYDPILQMWREFPTLIGLQGAIPKPGIIGWLGRLKEEGCLDRSHFRFQVTGIKYGDKDFFIDHFFCDSLSFSSALLTTLGQDWVSRIIDEIGMASKLAEQVGQLAQNLALASGASKGSSAKESGSNSALLALKEQAREQVFFRLDEPFRLWLESIDPIAHSHVKDQICEKWWLQARAIARKLGEELISQAGPKAFAGKHVVVGKGANETEKLFTAGGVYNRFLARTSTRDAL